MPAKKRKRSRKKTQSWEQIGQTVGSKIEKEFKGKMPNGMCSCGCGCGCSCKNDSGFCGRLLFIIGLLIVLTNLGYLPGVSIWLKILIGAGFAFMKF